MNIFISWSGERSKSVAELLRNWIPDILEYAKPWLSKNDIAAGQRWAQEIAQALEGTNFGIVCLTPENITSSWLMYEAGALSKSISDSRIIPILLDLDVSDIGYPLAQFQCIKLDSHGLWRLIDSINSHADREQRLTDNRAKRLFDAFWNGIEERINFIKSQSTPQIALSSDEDIATTGSFIADEKQRRSQDVILEELVTTVRTLIREKDNRNGTQGKSGHDEFIEFINHTQAFENVTKLIKDYIEDVKPDHIEINLMAVSMKYSLPWFENTLMKIAEGNPTVSFLCKIVYINENHLSRLHLDTKDCNWAEESSFLSKKLDQVMDNFCKTIFEQDRTCNIRFETSKYDEIPQRHGILLRLREEHIFLSVTDWDMTTDSGFPRLTAGTNLYRHYDSTGETGRYWINLFKNCFSFYSKYQKLLKSPM